VSFDDALERLDQLIRERDRQLAMDVTAALHLRSHATPGVGHAPGDLPAGLVQLAGQLRQRLGVDQLRVGSEMGKFI